MSKKIKIDPITRIEGHMAVEAVLDGGVVKEAFIILQRWIGLIRAKRLSNCRRYLFNIGPNCLICLASMPCLFSE